MPAKKTKKKFAEKASELSKQLPSEELKKNIEGFTLPSSEENTTPEADNIATPSPSLTQDSLDESAFWQTKKGIIWTSLFGVSILMALVAGVFIYRQGIIKSGANNQNTSISLPTSIEESKLSSSPSSSPSATPTSEVLDASKYSIEVLNGSGILGEAAKAKGLLEQEKFIVSSIGNADQSNYQKTIIQAKKTVLKEFLDNLCVTP